MFNTRYSGREMESLNHCELLDVGKSLLPLSLVKLGKLGKQTNKQTKTKSFSGPVSLSCCRPGKEISWGLPNTNIWLLGRALENKGHLPCVPAGAQTPRALREHQSGCCSFLHCRCWASCD